MTFDDLGGVLRRRRCTTQPRVAAAHPGLPSLIHDPQTPTGFYKRRADHWARGAANPPEHRGPSRTSVPTTQLFLPFRLTSPRQIPTSQSGPGRREFFGGKPNYIGRAGTEKISAGQSLQCPLVKIPKWVEGADDADCAGRGMRTRHEGLRPLRQRDVAGQYHHAVLYSTNAPPRRRRSVSQWGRDGFRRGMLTWRSIAALQKPASMGPHQ